MTPLAYFIIIMIALVSAWILSSLAVSVMTLVATFRKPKADV